MKNKLILPAILAVVVLGGTLTLRLFPRTLSADQCSDLYRKYANTDGINASFINNKHINDSIFVDMTILQAVSDSGWALLLRDFNLSEPPQDVIDFVGPDFMFAWSAPKKDYSLPTDSIAIDNDEITCAWALRIITVFHITSEQQLKDIRYYNYENMMQQRLEEIPYKP
jgi:hypothetical protein